MIQKICLAVLFLTLFVRIQAQEQKNSVGFTTSTLFNGDGYRLTGIGFNAARKIGYNMAVNLSYSSSSGGVKASKVLEISQLAFLGIDPSVLMNFEHLNIWKISLSKDVRMSDKGFMFLKVGFSSGTLERSVFGDFLYDIEGNIDPYESYYVVLTTKRIAGIHVGLGYKHEITDQIHFAIGGKFLSNPSFYGLETGLSYSFSFTNKNKNK
ncbi:MAG: hypothetical protein IPN89_15145 [Saprospiraceae bacterium]|nr:hypothetical protein [Saprospiraceae bacterium]